MKFTYKIYCLSTLFLFSIYNLFIIYFSSKILIFHMNLHTSASKPSKAFSISFYIFFSFFALTFFPTKVTPQCFTTLPLDGQLSTSQTPFKIQSGSFSMLSTELNGSYGYYNITHQFSNIDSHNYETALSIIYIENYQDTNTLGFSAKPIKFDKYLTVLVTIPVTAAWNLIHTHYLIADREDFRIGMFSIQALLPNSESQLKKVSHQLTPHWSKELFLIKFMVFLTGIKTEDTKVRISIVQDTHYFQDSKLNLQIMISPFTAPIEYIDFSFFLYTNYNSAISIAPISNPIDIISDAIQQTTQETTLNYFQEEMFFGMTVLSSESILTDIQNLNNEPIQANLQGSMSRLYNLNTNSERGAEANEEILKTSFHVVGFKFQNSAIFSGLNIVIGIKNLITECLTVNQCNILGGFSLNEENTGRKCIICPSNQAFNPETGLCQCLEGYGRNNSQDCLLEEYLCREGEVYLEGSCYKFQKTSLAV